MTRPAPTTTTQRTDPMPFYRVNHNGTEDWTDPPAGTRRDDEGRVLFDDLSSARAWADVVARDVVAALVTDGGMTPDEARATLIHNDRNGVPVQIVSDLNDGVVGWVVPRTVPAPGEHLTPREREDLDALLVRVRAARSHAERLHDTVRSRTEWGTAVTARASEQLRGLERDLQTLMDEAGR